MKDFLIGILCVVLAFMTWSYFSDADTHVVKALHYKLNQGKHADVPAYPPIIKLIGGDKKFFCSAFVIDNHYAVTAAHCLDENGKLRKDILSIFVEDNQDTGIKAKAVGMATRSDLGLLEGDFTNFQMLKTDTQHFGFLDSKTVYLTCGYPYGNLKISCVPFSPEKNNGFAIEGAGYLVPGMSGGAVINVLTNEAVALNSYAGEGVVGVFPLYGLQGAFHLE